MKQEYPKSFRNCRALEIGSLNVNGSVRQFFDHCQYTGIDCHAGKDVDVVTLAHEFDGGPFDTVISCEAFEHDPHLRQTLDAAYRMLATDGLFVATWAGPARPEHGTARTDGNTWGPASDYYRGVSADEFLTLVGRKFFPRQISVKPDKDGGEEDVYFWGIKSCLSA